MSAAERRLQGTAASVNASCASAHARLHAGAAHRVAQTTLRHLAATTPVVATTQCAAAASDDKPKPPTPPQQQQPQLRPIEAIALPQPTTVEIDDRTPREAWVFPLQIRPLFPHLRVRAVARQNTASATIDRIKRILERAVETDERAPPSPSSTVRKAIQPQSAATPNAAANSSSSTAANSNSNNSNSNTPEQRRRAALWSGPLVITDKDFVEAVTRLRNNGEHHIVLSLSRIAAGLPLTNIMDVHPVGVLASIDHIEGNKPAIGATLTIVRRVCLVSAVPRSPLTLTAAGHQQQQQPPTYIRAVIKPLDEESYPKDSAIVRALVLALVGKITELSKLNHPLFSDQLQLVLYKIQAREPGELADLCASLTLADGLRLQAVLAELNVPERLKKVLALVSAEVDVLKVINSKASFLNRPGGLPNMAAGGGGPLADATGALRSMRAEREERNQKLVNELRDRFKALTLPEATQKVVDDELARLESMDPTINAAEHYACRNYVNWLASLPWGLHSTDNLNIERVNQVLNEDHYGLPDVKERILEYISVGVLTGALQGKILCLVGPPGVGKTSLGRSIARALDRKFYRFTVGGLTDVAEIKGHRRTYVGALPGKFIQAMKAAKTSNPVILIDEIDKMHRGREGDPAAALLEALDPEQNRDFSDNYLEVPFDLSKVLFICTANSLDTIPRPLLDRMEVLKLTGYFLDEKLSIARRHLLPTLHSQSGLKQDLQIDDGALRQLIGQYCREAGVRSLQRHLEKIYRKNAHRAAKNEELLPVTADTLEQLLGKPKYPSDRLYDGNAPPGVVTGLAYNQIGGALVWIEAVCDIAKGPARNDKPAINTTGKLGEVMKESTAIALTYAKRFLQDVAPGNDFFDRAKIHIHFPEGAVQKDGPSAGCAIATAFLSLALNRSVSTALAMTGELTLTGRVLPVGGIKEKLMAAKRSSVADVILPSQNRKHWDELPEALRAGIQPHFADTYADVFKLAFPSLAAAGNAAASGANRDNIVVPLAAL